MKRNKVIKTISICLLLIFSVFTFMVNFSFSTSEQTKNQIQASIMKKEEKELAKLGYWDSSHNRGYIYTLNDLIEFRNAVNNGTSHSGQSIYLMADINMSGTDWVPIGTSTNPFKGNFYGYHYGTEKNNVIKNLKITSSSSTKDLGLFGYIDTGTIEQLTISVDTITQNNSDLSTGALVGSVKGLSTIKNIIVASANSSSKIYVTKPGSIGGVIGSIHAQANNCRITIENCASSLDIVSELSSTSGSNQISIGGIVGRTNNFYSTYVNLVRYCYSSSDIYVKKYNSGYVYAGGIVGYDGYDTTNNIGGISIQFCINNSYFYFNDRPQSSSPGASSGKHGDMNYGVKYTKILKDSSKSFAGGIIGNGSGTKTIVSSSINYTSASSGNSPTSGVKFDDIKFLHETSTALDGYLELTAELYSYNFYDIGNSCKITKCYSVESNKTYSDVSYSNAEIRSYALIADIIRSGGQITSFALREMTPFEKLNSKDSDYYIWSSEYLCQNRSLYSGSGYSSKSTLTALKGVHNKEPYIIVVHEMSMSYGVHPYSSGTLIVEAFGSDVLEDSVWDTSTFHFPTGNPSQTTLGSLYATLSGKNWGALSDISYDSHYDYEYIYPSQASSRVTYTIDKEYRIIFQKNSNGVYALRIHTDPRDSTGGDIITNLGFTPTSQSTPSGLTTTSTWDFTDSNLATRIDTIANTYYHIVDGKPQLKWLDWAYGASGNQPTIK